MQDVCDHPAYLGVAEDGLASVGDLGLKEGILVQAVLATEQKSGVAGTPHGTDLHAHLGHGAGVVEHRCVHLGAVSAAGSTGKT